MQRAKLFNFVLLLLVFSLFSLKLGAEQTEEAIYGHISFVDSEATVIHEDDTQHKAVVNLPVVPGDHLITGENGRCELQFDNGTIVRLDKSSRIKVTTVLAPSLTSKWKVTTLQLMRGNLCVMNQSYNQEKFQVLTPNAALDLKRRSTSYIQLKENGETFVFAERGKIGLMYGEDIDSIKTETLKSELGCIITTNHQLRINEGKREIDFTAWNKYMNKNFVDLHKGISKVPAKLNRSNKALIYWAEKWSSFYGEWVYDELFGYVWKPADEIFAYQARPFFHADYVKINGKLFLVPQEPWGWAPAHMGTWVWTTKGGWTWIPGSGFTTGVFTYSANAYFPTLGHWIYYCYGDYDLYYFHRNHGEGAWRTAYYNKYKIYKKSPVTKVIPKYVRKLLGNINKAPVKVIKERLGAKLKSPIIAKNKIKPTQSSKKVSHTAIKTTKITSSGSSTIVLASKSSDSLKFKDRKFKNAMGKPGPSRNFRDWSPDSRWALKKGVSITYSSQKNAVICPKLKLSSHKISNAQRASLRRSSSASLKSGNYRGSSSSGSSGSGSTSTSSSSSSRSSSSRSTSTRSGGGGGGGAKKK